MYILYSCMLALYIYININKYIQIYIKVYEDTNNVWWSEEEGIFVFHFVPAWVYDCVCACTCGCACVW